jgi:hypothetical protein
LSNIAAAMRSIIIPIVTFLQIGLSYRHVYIPVAVT